MASKELIDPQRCFTTAQYRMVTDTGATAQVCPDHITEFLRGMRTLEAMMVVRLGNLAGGLEINRCEFYYPQEGEG